MSKNSKNYVDVTAIDAQVVKEFVDKYSQIENELDLVKEQMKGLKNEYEEKFFGKQTMKTIIKSIQLYKAQADIEGIKFVSDTVFGERT